MVFAMAHHRWVACMVPAVVLLSLATDAAATLPTQALRDLFAQANRIVVSPDPDLPVEARRQMIRTLAHEVLDFREAASLALGPEWQARTPVERAEFTRLFAHLLEGGYVAMMGSNASMHGGLIMDYVGESIEGDTAVVRTIAVARSGEDLSVDYRMVRVDTGWLVRDINVGGLSLVDTYRAQFQRVIQAASYAGLVARLRARASNAGSLVLATIAGAPPSRADVWQFTVPDIADMRPVASIATKEPGGAAPQPAAAVPTITVAPAAAPATVAIAHTAAAPPTSVAFWVQVGTFRDDDAVVDLMERLRQHAVTLFNAAEPTPSGGREAVARVLVGPFSQRAEADAKLRELQATGLRPTIAELSP